MRCETARRRPPRLRAAASDPDTDNPDPGARERSCRHPREKSHRLVGDHDHDDDDGAQPRDQLDRPRLVHVRPAQPLRTGKKTAARVTKRAFCALWVKVEAESEPQSLTAVYSKCGSWCSG